ETIRGCMSKLPLFGRYISLMRVFGAFRVTETQLAIAHHRNQMLVTQILPTLAQKGCKLIHCQRLPLAQAANGVTQGGLRCTSFQGCKKGCKLRRQGCKLKVASFVGLGGMLG